MASESDKMGTLKGTADHKDEKSEVKPMSLIELMRKIHTLIARCVYIVASTSTFCCNFDKSHLATNQV